MLRLTSEIQYSQMTIKIIRKSIENLYCLYNNI